MKAIYKRELRSLFTGVVGYLFVAFFLAAVGIYASILCIRGGSTNYVYVYYNLCFLYLILVPILTMRSFSEERRQRTEQLLFSSPVSVADIVLGKYFALVTVFLAPMLLTGIYPLILRAYGPVNLPAVCGTALCFFLLGAAMIAIGVFISSLTENQLAAAATTFAVLLLIYLSDTLGDMVSARSGASVLMLSVLDLLLLLFVWYMTKNHTVALGTGIVLELVILAVYLLFPGALSGLSGRIIASLSLLSCMTDFVYGVIDIGAYVKCLSLAALFVFFTVVSVEKRRWS